MRQETEERPERQRASPDPRRWRILAVTLTVGFMVLLDVTIVNVAIPSMQQGLDTSPGTIQWVVSGYALALGLLLVTGGRLGDAHGRRTMMLIGLGGFIAASATAGLAPHVAVLIAARLVQGFAAGLLTPQSSGLIQSLFRGAERGIAFGLFGFTVSVSSAVGPVLGGILISTFGTENGWRWIFLVNVPIGLVLLVAIARLVPGRPADTDTDARLDLVGAVLLGATVLALLYPVVSLERGARLPLVGVVLVPVLAWAFVRWERHLVRIDRAPLLDLGLLRNVPGYATGILIGALYFTGFTGIFLVLSVFLQDGLGYDPLHAGLLLTPFALGSAVAAPIAGRLVSRVGRPLTIAALTVMISGLVSLAALVPAEDGGHGLWVVIVPTLLVAGLGGGAVVSPNITLSLNEVPTRMGGAAGAALQTGQRIGSAVGAALVMTSYQLVLASSAAPGVALRWALGVSVTMLGAALTAAVWSWRHDPPFDGQGVGGATTGSGAS